MNYVFPDKTDLVNHLYYQLHSPTPIKIQKTLYFLFAFYGATYGIAKNNQQENEFTDSNYPQYLFKPNFEAWMYGPIDVDVYKNTKQNYYFPKQLNKSKIDNVLNVSEKENIYTLINDICKEVDNVDDFTLITHTQENMSWIKAYETSTKIMRPDNIIKDYEKRN